MKKNQHIKRMKFYPLIGIVFLTIAAVIIISAIGYDIHYSEGKISAKKTGAIILGTRPGDAQIYLDGQIMNQKTPLFNLFTTTLDKVKPGLHNVKIVKEGFENWIGDFLVEPGKVSWGTSLLLVAQKRDSIPYNIPGTITQSVRSRDYSRIALLSRNPESGYTTLSEINTNNQTKIKIADIKTVADVNYKIMDYSWDFSKILVMVTKKTGTSHFVYDAKENGKSYDLSKYLPLGTEKIIFNPRRTDEVFYISTGELFKLNYQNYITNQYKDTDVFEIRPSSQGPLYLKKIADKYDLLRLDINENPVLITKDIEGNGIDQITYVPSIDGYLINSNGQLVLYKKQSGKYTGKLLAENVGFFALSPHSNWIFYNSGKNYYTYGLERNNTYLALKNREINSVCWLEDEVNLIYSENGKMKLITREGNYDKFLFDVDSKYDILASPNSSNFYFLNKSLKNEKSTDLYSYKLNY